MNPDQDFYTQFNASISTPPPTKKPSTRTIIFTICIAVFLIVSIFAIVLVHNLTKTPTPGNTQNASLILSDQLEESISSDFTAPVYEAITNSLEEYFLASGADVELDLVDYSQSSNNYQYNIATVPDDTIYTLEILISQNEPIVTVSIGDDYTKDYPLNYIEKEGQLN